LAGLNLAINAIVAPGFTRETRHGESDIFYEPGLIEAEKGET
jgi:hypothetical protein